MVDEPFQQRVSPSGVYVDSGGILWGSDAVQESYQFPAAATLADAAALPALPRNVAGDPLAVTFPAWRSGNVLRVRWAASATGILSPGASGVLVPRVSVAGGAFQFVQNGAQIGLVGVPGALVYAFGECALALATAGPVVVQLGIALVRGAPGDRLDIQGGPLTLADPPTFASTWLFADRFPSAAVLPTSTLATLAALPIPT